MVLFGLLVFRYVFTETLRYEKNVTQAEFLSWFKLESFLYKTDCLPNNKKPILPYYWQMGGGEHMD